MSITFSTITIVIPDIINFDKMPTKLDNVVVAFGSPLKDNDVALKFNKSGVDIVGQAIFWDDVADTAMIKWGNFKDLEGTVGTLGANGESFTNVVLLAVESPKKQLTGAGSIATFGVLFRRLEE